jgi:hypothetical protein
MGEAWQSIYPKPRIHTHARRRDGIIASAAQTATPVIGYLYIGLLVANLVAAFHQGLAEIGYVEGKNVAIEYGNCDLDAV